MWRRRLVICAPRLVTGLKRFRVIVPASTALRVNDQFRICFMWHDGNVRDAEIVEYH
jgi:hypothetical protein